MKKHLLPLLALSIVLASCSPSGSSSSSSSSQESSSSSQSSSSSSSSSSSTAENIFVEDGWPKAQGSALYALFLDHLYPYYDFSKAGYSYTFQTYEAAYEMDAAVLTIENFPVEEESKYLAALTNGTGFKDVSVDHGLPAGSYEIEKVFSDYSRILASFSVKDEDGYVLTEGSGTFRLEISPVRIARELWQGEKIVHDVSDLLEKDITLPEPSQKADKYIGIVRNVNNEPVPTLYFVGADVRESYSAQLASLGWKKVPVSDLNPSNGVYYISSDESLSAFIYLADFESTVTAMEISKATYTLGYPEEKVNSCLEYLFLSTSHIELPVPTSTGVSYYSVNDHVEDVGFFDVYLYGVDCAEEYEKQLIASSDFHRVDFDYNGRFYSYGDENETIFAYVFYSESSKATTIGVARNIPNYHGGWPEKKANQLIEKLGGETYLPIDSEATFSNISDFTADGGLFVVATKNLDENLNYVDTTERYAGLLNASGSGWTYDSIENRWHDAKNKLSVSLRFYEISGLEISVKPYHVSYETLSEEQLSSAFSKIGVTGYSFINADGVKGYCMDDSVENHLLLTVWGVEETTLSAYQNKLLETHSIKNVRGVEYYYDASKKVGFTMEYDDYWKSITIDFQSFENCFNFSDSNLSSYVDQIKERVDPGFSLPTFPHQESSFGFITLAELGMFTTLNVVIFETGLLEELGNKLVEDGYQKRGEGEDAYYAKVGDVKVWSVDLEEDETNGYTRIVVEGSNPATSSSSDDIFKQNTPLY